MLPPSRKLPLLGRYSAGDRATPCRAPAAGTSANFDSVLRTLGLPSRAALKNC
ncbi:hypothetical protein C6T59_14385 [Burkholderia multivorans]|nr:hypothetical protein C6Q01_12830 [Burkholderia multivorans]PRF88381.1 hypothetical protein C6Q23_17925 [Burkholderia multivorans]PRG64920.1 hypothetical protein C6T59_14385 [Burkholderia multivorans]